MNKEKKVRKLSERIFAIGLSIICEVAFLLWLLQPCSDATLLLLGFGSAILLYWSLDWFEKLLLKRLEKKEKGSIIYGTDESELILQPHFHFRY